MAHSDGRSVHTADSEGASTVLQPETSANPSSVGGTMTHSKRTYDPMSLSAMLHNPLEPSFNT